MSLKSLRSLSAFSAALACLCTASFTHAASIVGSVGPEFPANATYNLTDLGTLDWAYWTLEGNPATGVPTNSMSGATLIGSATAVGGGSVRGSTTTTGAVPENYFTFSNGSTPASGTGVMTTGVFNSQLVTTGAGVSVLIDLPTVQTYTVYVWASGFSINSSTFTAALNGATSFVSSAIIDNTGTSAKDTYLVTLTVTPNTAGDDLTISAVAGASGGASSHILISGIAISGPAAIPEPSTVAALAGVGALVVGVIARRRGRSAKIA